MLFRSLESEGLIEMIPNRGAFVVGISESEIEDMYCLRKEYEILAVRWAIARISKSELEDLALLRDSGVAASRLCQMLPNSKWVAEALSNRPEAIAWLDSDLELQAPDPQALQREASSLIDRHANPEDAASRVRAVAVDRKSVV